MVIIGLIGSIGSGKTTLAQYLADQTDKSRHFESWELVAEVANQLRGSSLVHPNRKDISAINGWLQQLPEIIEHICSKTVHAEQLVINSSNLNQAPENYIKLFEYLEKMENQAELQTIEIKEQNKEDFRSILQWLGGYLVKTVGAGVWYDEIIRRIQATPDIELATVGGVRFPGDARRIVNVGGKIIYVDRPSISIKDAKEITERERALIVPDTTIVNDAGLPELSSTAGKIWKDIQKDALLIRYVASKVQA